MTSQTELTSVLQVKEGETIYDSCWYPFMNSYDHSTCFFLSTSASNPIHMWDAFSGKVIDSIICLFLKCLFCKNLAQSFLSCI